MSALELSVTENARFTELERTIEIGLETFVQVGSALLEIREARLYRANYGTFELYCRERWQMERAHAYRLIDSAEAVKNLSPMGDIQPTSERQIRPLTRLEPEQQREAWAEATKDNPAPKAKQVCEAAEIIAPVHKWEKPTIPYRQVSFSHEGLTPKMTDEEKVIKRFKQWVCTIAKERNLPRKQVIQFVNEQINGGRPVVSEGASDGEFCEVGWLLLTTERDMAVLALTPRNEDWQESALAFFGSLRKRKIITVS